MSNRIDRERQARKTDFQKNLERRMKQLNRRGYPASVEGSRLADYKGYLLDPELDGL